MRRPVVGVIGNAYRIEDRFATQLVGERNLRAVAEVSGALPLMFAGSPDLTDIGALLDAVDGVVLTGARANVHPTRFRTEPDPRHEPYDLHRDDLALALSEACVDRGIPLFGICRGLQEMNVAFGGSLHPEIRELPGRMNHRMPRLETGEIHPDPDVVFADRHDVSLVPGGAFARLLGCETIRVNSLHGQGILEPGGRVVVEGVAEDGTIETIRITIPSTAPCSRHSAKRYRYAGTVPDRPHASLQPDRSSRRFSDVFAHDSYERRRQPPQFAGADKVWW
jgi:putative glutamine amidotransferase